MVSQIRKEEAEMGPLHKDTIAKVRAEGFAVTTMYSAYRSVISASTTPEEP
jgi:hypothetical protein